MIEQHDILGTTGFGIDLVESDPEYPTIEVDLAEQTVDGVPFAEFTGIAAPHEASALQI